MAITFSYSDRRIRIGQKRIIKQFISLVFNMEETPLRSLNYVFCSDEYLLGINQKFLKHDFYTDIITFDLRSNVHEPVTGEIYISIDRVKDNCINHKTSYEEELLRVIFHGALHLCGFKDKRKSEILLMRQKEAQYLRLYNESKIRST